MLIKSLLLVILTTSFGFLGLLGISANFLHTENIPPPEHQTLQSKSDSENKSSGFENIYNEIKNSAIDYSALEKEIKTFDNEIQKSYLLALLRYRQQKYDEAYSLLLNNLKNTPTFADYYDLLVRTAKILDKINQLKKDIKSSLSDESLAFNFAQGLIEFYSLNMGGAIEYFKKVSKLENSFKETLFWLANSYRVKGDYISALESLQKLKSSLSSDDDYLSSVEIAIGTNQYMSGNYDEAEKSYRKALELSKRNFNTVDEIKSSGNLAIIKDIYGEVEEARNLLSSSILKAKKIENSEQLAFLYSELGVSFTYTNELIKARQNYLKSLELYSILKNGERLSYLSGNIASIYLQQSNYNEAIKFYKKGMDYSGDNVFGKILNLTGIADVYGNLSNYSKALEYYKRAGELADSIKNAFAQFKVKEGIGVLFLNVNRPQKALEMFKEANELIDIDAYPFESAEMYYKMGFTYLLTKNYIEAEKILEKGLNISDNSGYTYYSLIIKTELANLYLQTNNLKTAEKVLTELLPISAENSLIQMQGVQSLYLGKIYNKMNKQREGLKLLVKAYELSETVDDYNNQIEAGSLIVDYYLKNQNFTETERWFKNITQVIDKISPALITNNQIQISHFSGVEKIFEKMISFYLSQGRDEDAFNLLEKYRSRNTVQNLVNLKLLTATGDESLLNNFIDTKWEVNSGLYEGEQQQKLKEKLDSLSSAISGNDSHLMKILTSDPWMKYKEIKEKLSNKENLISIFTSNDFTEIFLTTNTELKSFRLEISRDSLVTLMKQIAPIYQTYTINKEVFVNQDLFSFNAEAAYKFYETLLADAINNIPEKDYIIFSLPEELLVLPFEFLVTKWEKGESPYYYKNKSFLIKRNPVSYTPSVSVYINQKTIKETKNLKNLLVGDPLISEKKIRLSYRGGMLEDENFSLRNIDLFPLEYSKDEIENIDDLISGNVVLLADKATESNFKSDAPESNIIHVSSHSFLYNSQPLILFSQSDDKKNDGFLELGEIVQMNLKSDLVVLSSCRSGLGEVEEAEGTLGMQKAFFDAGAASVMVSLWDVNDKYTAYFMKNFYENLSNGMNKIESLQKAKIDFIEKYSANPYYWSAFILAGNISNIDLKKPGNFYISYLIPLLILIGIFASGFVIIRKIRSAH